MSSGAEPLVPRSKEGLEERSQEIAIAAQANFVEVWEEQTHYFGEAAAHRALWALLEAHFPEVQRVTLRSRFDRLGWRGFIDEEGYRAIDFLDLTYRWRDAMGYAAQGTAPGEPVEGGATLTDRKARIVPLIAMSERGLKAGWLLPGDEYRFILEGVAARAAIDGIGGRVSVEGVRLLSSLSQVAVRNAIRIGELHPDDEGYIAAEEARAWLARRREFCPSRWKDPNDNQWCFDPNQVATPDQEGMIWVPRDADGALFIPEHVVRPARRTAGISITIGAKGEERQYGDFYQALTALASMKVARWRRRNAAGNWGIVRARGAWVAISKAEIDQQLEAKLAEAS